MTTHAYHFPKQNLGGAIVKQIREFGFSDPKIGFERYFVDFALYDALRGAFSEKTSRGSENCTIGSGRQGSRGSGFDAAGGRRRPQGDGSRREGHPARYGGVGSAGRGGVRHVEGGFVGIVLSPAGGFRRPHAPRHPTASSKEIRSGEVVVVHLGATCEGYCAKMARPWPSERSPRPGRGRTRCSWTPSSGPRPSCGPAQPPGKWNARRPAGHHRRPAMKTPTSKPWATAWDSASRNSTPS